MKYKWKDDHGKYLPSKSSQQFLDKIEMMFSCKIDREYKLQYGGKPNQVRYYDGKFKNVLIELDGTYFHSTKKAQKNDTFKAHLAERFRYEVLRFELNSVSEIDRVLAENLDTLKTVFGTKEPGPEINIIDKIMAEV